MLQYFNRDALRYLDLKPDKSIEMAFGYKFRMDIGQVDHIERQGEGGTVYCKANQISTTPFLFFESSSSSSVFFSFLSFLRFLVSGSVRAISLFFVLHFNRLYHFPSSFLLTLLLPFFFTFLLVPLPDCRVFLPTPTVLWYDGFWRSALVPKEVE